MTGLTTAIADLLGAVGQSFRLSALVPSLAFVVALAVLLDVYLVEPAVLTTFERLEFAPLTTVSVLALLLSYSMTVVNVPLTQLFEGYSFRHTWLGRTLIQNRLHHRVTLQVEMKRLDVQLPKLRQYLKAIEGIRPNDYWLLDSFWSFQSAYLKGHIRHMAIEDALTNTYPGTDEVLPTRLGNVFAAFEDYPRERYRMASVTLWPRLLPALIKSGYADRIEREKMGFDFFLNLAFLTCIYTLIWCVVALAVRAELPLLVLTAGIIMTWVFYRLAVMAGRYYGVKVKTAFDLHRSELRAAFNMPKPQDFAHERADWQKLSAFLQPQRGGKEAPPPFTNWTTPSDD